MQVLLADGLDVGDGAEGLRRGPGHVEPETYFVVSGVLRASSNSSRESLGPFHGHAYLTRPRRRPDDPDPTRTRSVFDRSPMIFLIGSGSFRTRVGMARIWSPLARVGVLEQVDDLDPVLAFEVLLADLLQVREGRKRFRGLSGDVEFQLPEIHVFFWVLWFR